MKLVNGFLHDIYVGHEGIFLPLFEFVLRVVLCSIHEHASMDEQCFDLAQIVGFSQEIRCTNYDPAAAAATCEAILGWIDSILGWVGKHIIDCIKIVLLSRRSFDLRTLSVVDIENNAVQLHSGVVHTWRPNICRQRKSTASVGIEVCWSTLRL